MSIAMAATPKITAERTATGTGDSRRLAAAITLVLFIGWTVQNWIALRNMRLPDNDDMMRIAQIRDWLGGQAFNDLLQHRLGPPGGASMHWSRLGDLGPAAMLLLLTPSLGAHWAEVATVIGYQAALFFAYLLLAARIAGKLDGDDARSAGMLLAALAFPTVGLFAPGRIDHHAPQILLTMALVDVLLDRPSWRSGVVGGVSVAASLAIGLEAAPEIVAAMAAMGLVWALGGRDDDRRAAGFAFALGGATLAWRLVAKPHIWPAEWCDGLTASSFRATLVLAAAWGATGAAGAVLRAWRDRLFAGAVIGFAGALMAYRLSPVCFAGPYGALDPFLQRYWMSNVSEALGLFGNKDTVGVMIAHVGVSLGGTAIALQRVARDRMLDRRWIAFALFLLISLAAAVLQIRVTYVLAGIAALAFAGPIVRARREARPSLVVACWLLGAGVLWNAVGRVLDLNFARRVEAARIAARECTGVESVQPVTGLPSGTIMAPIDLGSYLIGMSDHRVIAAGYHRNNSGNMAAYRFFLSSPDKAWPIARAWNVDYVALCKNHMREGNVLPLRKGSLIEKLQERGTPPSWLRQVHTGSDMRLYRVLQRG